MKGILKYLITCLAGIVIWVMVPLYACHEPAFEPVPPPSPAMESTPSPAPMPSQTTAPTPDETPVQALPAKFEIGLLDISPVIVPLNQPVTVSVDISNVGGTEDACSLTMTVDGTRIETRVIKIAPESTEKVSFVLVTGKPGIHEIKINGVSGTFQTLASAELTVSNLVITPTIAEAGHDITAPFSMLV